MKISKEELGYVARLARLDLDDMEVEKFSKQISDVLEYVDTLNAVDTTGIKATSQAIFVNNAFREDITRPSMGNQNAMANAPESEDGEIIVPKIIG